MTVYTSDAESYFEKNPKTGKTWKSAEWQLVSDTEMIYTAYGEDGTINKRTIHKGENMAKIWNRYHTKQ